MARGTTNAANTSDMVSTNTTALNTPNTLNTTGTNVDANEVLRISTYGAFAEVDEDTHDLEIRVLDNVCYLYCTLPNNLRD